MAQYTIELRDIPEEIRALALEGYPIFDESYRKHLDTLIVDHFWYYEIAHESIDQWVQRFRLKMREIMPYYNQFYESELTKRDPFSTADMTSTSEATSKATSDSTSASKNSSVSDNENKSGVVNSETPQVRLSGDSDYATSAVDSVGTSHGTGSGESSATGSESSTQGSTSVMRQSGRGGHMAALIQAHRDAIINVDMMLLGALEPLFMTIWTPDIDMLGGRYGY